MPPGRAFRRAEVKCVVPPICNGGRSSSSTARGVREEARLEDDDFVQQELQRYSQQVQLFAYPTSRQIPWAVLCFLSASGGLTLGGTLYWRYSVCEATNKQELQQRLRNFEQLLRYSSLWRDLSHGESLQALLLASISRVGEQPLRLCVDNAILLCCGTLLERLHGARWMVLFMVSSTVLTNAVAALMHDRIASSEGLPISSSAGSITALAATCALAYGRWAVWPGVPIPVGWLVAPLIVAEASTAAAYVGGLREHPPPQQEQEEAEQTHEQKEHADSEGTDPHQHGDLRDSYEMEPEDAPLPSGGLHLYMAMAACEAIEDRARERCLQPPGDIVSWHRDVLLPALPEHPHLHRDGAWLADACGAVLAVFTAAALRLR
eukprot:CAMPEP_0178393548 /NCGR_PEP_ID=MMETSP0689_2-20121128/12244_1 /TAXON_ID=160604 /ORGANISM="Amphidinium massartii, Strain CS-259" /LENGTH=377 /DNA_ID=CAMNT_0020014143 /DNA_START=146 /DNA_END=1279 /DNA_ORIENTATION=-